MNGAFNCVGCVLSVCGKRGGGEEVRIASDDERKMTYGVCVEAVRKETPWQLAFVSKDDKLLFSFQMCVIEALEGGL